MADSNWGVNDALAVKLFSKRLIREALKATFANQFMGESQDDLIQEKSETSKGAGDKVTFGRSGRVLYPEQCEVMDDAAYFRGQIVLSDRKKPAA